MVVLSELRERLLCSCNRQAPFLNLLAVLTLIEKRLDTLMVIWMCFPPGSKGCIPAESSEEGRIRGQVSPSVIDRNTKRTANIGAIGISARNSGNGPININRKEHTCSPLRQRRSSPSYAMLPKKSQQGTLIVSVQT